MVFAVRDVPDDPGASGLADPKIENLPAAVDVVLLPRPTLQLVVTEKNKINKKSLPLHSRLFTQ